MAKTKIIILVDQKLKNNFLKIINENDDYEDISSTIRALIRKFIKQHTEKKPVSET